MKYRPRLGVEGLEDRSVPALFGQSWPDADHLTISFVPDGTDVAGVQSDLFRTLDAQLPTADWQKDVVRAFQTWAQYGNVNVSVVGDNGRPFGDAGPVQGSPWYGDIRIAARPLSDNVLAVTTPFDLTSSWAGEVVVNSTKLFGRGDAGGRYDLYTVMLQEAGHALGLDNNPNTASAMFTTYQGARAGVASPDVTAIQRLYGVRAADGFDAKGSNDTAAAADAIGFVSSATQLNGTDGTDGKTPLVAAGDITTLADVDYYAYKVPAGQAGFTVALLTGGISQLRATVSVLDDKGAVVVSAVAPEGSAEPFQLPVTGAKAGATYRVKVGGATADVFGMGAYRLAVGTGAAAVTAVIPPTKTGFVNADNHADDTLSKAVALGDARPASDLRWDFVSAGSVASPNAAPDVDWFKVHTKKYTPRVAVVVVSAFDPTALRPAVEVYDKNGVRVAAEVLSNTGGTVILQVAGVLPDTDYFVRVAAADPAAFAQGNYTLAVDFRAEAVTLPTFAAGILGGETTQAATTFGVLRSQAVYFEVAGAGRADVAVRMTVYDANNRAVLSLMAKGGEVAGRDVFLAPGTYTVRFVAAAQNGGELPAFEFRGRYTLTSDPVGPQPLDMTAAPAGTTVSTPVLTTYSTKTSTTTPLLAPSTVYTAPVSVSTTQSVVWYSAPPPPTFYQVTLKDVYSVVWR